MKRAIKSTFLFLAASLILLTNCTPAEPPTEGESPFLTPAETWLKILGASDNISGTSVVRLAEDNYVVAAGFTPGLASDFALLGMSTDGSVEARRFTSDRVHSGGMGADFWGSTLFVNAIALGGEALSLTFDNVWLPEAGGQDMLSGWQIALASGGQPSVALTDLVNDGDTYFLRLAVGDSQSAHLGFLRVNADGEVEAAVEYPAVRVDNDGKLFLTSEGELLTAGYLRAEDGAETAVLLWLDRDGELVRSVTVKMQPYQLHPDAPSAQSYGIQDLALLPDGDIILVQNFQVCSIGCPGSGALITRLSSSGEQVWTVGLHALYIGGQTFISEIRQEGDALILTGGSSVFLEPTAYIHVNALMASLDASTGQPNWIRSIGPQRYTGSSNEFKTDIGYALLPTGDGRVIITGTTDSFGSGQVWTGGPYYDHYDLLLGVADLGYGGIRGASSVMWTPDLNDEYDVWAEAKVVDLGTCSECTSQTLENLSMTPVEYLAETLTLEARDLSSGFDSARQSLTFTFDDKGRYMISSRTPFIDSSADTLDYDGLDQAWENAALEEVKPIFELDEDESWLENQDEHHVVLFVRVTPYPSIENPVYILFEYAVTWSMDYGAVVLDPTFLTDALVFHNHRGDIEKVILAWRLETERSMRLEWVYTSAHNDSTLHEGFWHAYDPTCNRGNISDTGSQPGQDEPEIVGTELMCAALKFKQNRVFLQISQDKHAIYPNGDICNNLILVTALGGGLWGESCEGGGDNYSFDAYNVGEPDHHLIDKLYTNMDWIGLTEEQSLALEEDSFPNERAYSGNLSDPLAFCGGLLPPPDDCSRNTVGNALDHLHSFMYPLLVERLGPTTYRVRIATKNDTFAGTDSTVYITLYGENGTSYRQALDGSFEKGAEDIFHIGNPQTGYVGDIVRIGLQKDDDNSNPDRHVDMFGYINLTVFNPTPDWYVQKVEVENKVTGEKWVFNVDEEITDSQEHIYQPEPGE